MLFKELSGQRVHYSNVDISNPQSGVQEYLERWHVSKQCDNKVTENRQINKATDLANSLEPLCIIITII